MQHHKTYKKERLCNGKDKDKDKKKNKVFFLTFVYISQKK